MHFDEVSERVDKIQEENRELQKELASVKAEAARSKFSSFISKAQEISGGGKCNGKLFISKIEDIDSDAVKAGIEMMSSKLGESIIVLASPRMVIVKVSDGFVKSGVNAGKIVGEIARATGANGGGRPNFAQGGVKDASKLDEILATVETELKG
jgi:alanyl-tRNA synthetase